MKKIYILDDNEDLLDIISHVLRRDYNVVSQVNTENIIDEINQHNPDLIILDHHVGDMNSTDIVTKLRIDNPGFSIPFILFSAHPKLKDTASAIGAVGYIEKPSEIAHIRSYIREILKD